MGVTIILIVGAISMTAAIFMTLAGVTAIGKSLRLGKTRTRRGQ